MKILPTRHFCIAIIKRRSSVDDSFLTLQNKSIRFLLDDEY